MCNPFQGTPNPFTPLQAVSAISCMVFRFLTLSDRHHREYHYWSAAFHRKAICRPLFLLSLRTIRNSLQQLRRIGKLIQLSLYASCHDLN